jgi:hypothetical protein
LRDDEHVSQAEPRRTTVERFGFERRHETRLCRLERRCEARQDGRDQRQRDGEADDAPVGRDLDADWNGKLRHHGEEQRRQPGRQQQAGEAADSKHHDRFGKEEAHQAPAAGAERQAHCDFTRASGAARQQHPGEVHARNQQQQRDDAHQQPEKARDYASPARHQRGARRDKGDLTIRLGVLAFQRFRDCQEFAIRLRARDTVAEPAAHKQPVRIPRRKQRRVAARHRLSQHRHRNPDPGFQYG